MKNILIIIILISTLVSCNNSDKYLEQLSRQNELMNKEIDRNYEIISRFSHNNKTKYGVWEYRCREIIKLRDTILNNRNNIDVIKYAVDYLDDFTKWFSSDQDDTYINFLNLDFDINDKIENEIFINKFLTVSNSFIDRLVFLSNINDFRFTTLASIVVYDKYKTTYSLGEDITAKIYFMAVDTTARPVIIMNNNEMIDTFDVWERGIFKTKANKKGINTIEGSIVIKHDYKNLEDTFPFITEYLVK